MDGKHIFLIMLGGFFGVILFIVLALMWIGSPVQDLVFSAHGQLLSPPDAKLSHKQAEALLSLMNAGAVLPAEAIIGYIVEFYTNLINIVLGLFGVLGIIAFMYIKSSSLKEAKQEAARHVSDFVRADEFSKIVADGVENNFNKNLDSYVTDYQERLEAIDSLADRVVVIESKLANQDSEDSIESDAVVN